MNQLGPMWVVQRTMWVVQRTTAAAAAVAVAVQDLTNHKSFNFVWCDSKEN